MYGAAVPSGIWQDMLVQAGDPLDLSAKTYRNSLEFAYAMLDDRSLYSQASAESLFNRSYSAIFIHGFTSDAVTSYMAAGITRGQAAPDLGVVPTPRLDATHAQVLTHFKSIAISRGSTQPEAAWRAVRYPAGDQEATQLAKAGWLPANVGSSAVKELLDFWKGLQAIEYQAQTGKISVEQAVSEAMARIAKLRAQREQATAGA